MNNEKLFEQVAITTEEEHGPGETIQQEPELALASEPVGHQLAPIEEKEALTPAFGKEDLEQVEHFAKLHMALRLTTLRITRPKDWLDIGGEPYLSAFGCQRLITLFRIRFEEVRHEIVRDPDGNYTIVVSGKACSQVLDQGGFIQAIGAARSDDGFLTKGGRVKASLGDVLKKAHTNFMARAIKTILGLGGLSWADLSQVGISRKDVERVDFASAEKTEADWVVVRIPYKEKDRFKQLVREACGVTPRFDADSKGWTIPREALEVKAIQELVQK